MNPYRQHRRRLPRGRLGLVLPHEKTASTPRCPIALGATGSATKIRNLFHRIPRLSRCPRWSPAMAAWRRAQASRLRCPPSARTEPAGHQLCPLRHRVGRAAARTHASVARGATAHAGRGASVPCHTRRHERWREEDREIGCV